MDGGTRAGRPLHLRSRTRRRSHLPGSGSGGGASKGTAGGSSRAPGRSAGLPARRRGEELRGRAGGAGPGVARSEVLYPPRFASGAGRVRTGRGHQGAGRDAAALRSCPWTDAAGQPGRTRAAAASLPRTQSPTNLPAFLPRRLQPGWGGR